MLIRVEDDKHRLSTCCDDHAFATAPFLQEWFCYIMACEKKMEQLTRHTDTVTVNKLQIELVPVHITVDIARIRCEMSKEKKWSFL
jgi:hypothetical protein